jgi:hypothetical protein
MVSISDKRKFDFYFDLKRKLNEHLNGGNKHTALDYTYETDIQSSSDGKKLKIALHMDPLSGLNGDSRTVTLRSLTNPSVAVKFNEISTPRIFNYSLDDTFFKALDSILTKVPQDFNSIETYTQSQEGDRIYVLKDNSELDNAFIYVRGGARLIKKILFPFL